MDGPGITAENVPHILGGSSAPRRETWGIANRLEYAAGYQPRLKHMGPRENPSEHGVALAT